MGRLIDATKLQGEMMDMVASGHYGLEDMIDAVIEQPTVDAVPVRCGQCKYYSHDMNCCAYVNGLQNVTKTDYCSYGRCADGERRSDD
jgi:uncharacterized ParB-like nuclease family protein